MNLASLRGRYREVESLSNHNSDSPSTMTQKGYDKLMAELIELRSTGRAEISRQLEEARSFGDLSENAEYAAAKEEQAKLETRISYLEFQLSKAKILDSSTIDNSSVTAGAGTVTELATETSMWRTAWNHRISSK